MPLKPLLVLLGFVLFILACVGLALAGWIYLFVIYRRLRRGAGETGVTN